MFKSKQIPPIPMYVKRWLSKKSTSWEAKASVGVSEGFKYRREDASGMNKVYVERCHVMFLIKKKIGSFLVQVAASMSWCLGSHEILELRCK